MPDWINALLFAATGVLVLSVWYQLLPAKKLPETRPSFAIFPKYLLPVGNLSDFTDKLLALGFKQVTQDRYMRGHIFGDFLDRWVQLSVKLDRQSNMAVIGSPYIAIAFDTGDVWKIANQLKG